MKTDIRIIDYSILTPWGDYVNNIISILNDDTYKIEIQN